MPGLRLDRRLQWVSDAELRDLWRETALLLSAKMDPVSGELPATYQAMYVRLRDEFARRGVQLSLFDL